MLVCDGSGDFNMNNNGQNKNVYLLIISLLFLAWRPIFLESETLKITTYYPAPYGGYNRLLTTGRTELARESGEVVWANHGVLQRDQLGSIELGGRDSTLYQGSITMPYIDFKNNTSDVDYHNRIILDTEKTLRVEGDFQVGVNDVGFIRKLCRVVAFNPPSGGYSITYCNKGNSGHGTATGSKKYTIIALGTGSFRSEGWYGHSTSEVDANGGIPMMAPFNGTMICCKFETISG